MLTASESTVRNVTKHLLKLPQDVYGEHNPHSSSLIVATEGYTDADNGILVALIYMNYLVLQPG
jgi:hypothetical protein